MPESARTTRRRTRSSQAVFKPRRSHRKSRNGCAECRRRHIRCDKNRPVCLHCGTGERACEYPTAADDSDGHVSGPAATSPSDTATAGPTTPADERPAAAPDDVFSATDLVIFHHAQTAMQHVGLGRKGQFHKVLALGMRHRARAPYLLDQLLALACVHLSFHLHQYTTPTPPAASVYAGLTASGLRHHATARQTRAVAAFNAHVRQVSGDVDVNSARFLFAGVLSLQCLAETLSVLRAAPTADQHPLGFGDFVDSVVACFQLHAGVRVATGGTLREFLPQSAELRDIMDFLHVADAGDDDWNAQPRGRECASLLALLARGESDMGAASLDACRGAANSLQWSFDMCHGLAVHDGPHAASAFAVTAPAGYVEALRRRAPEALVILAYYGVLLHRCRECWIFGDAGARMVRAVADHVGAYWREAMRWPLQETCGS